MPEKVMRQSYPTYKLAIGASRRASHGSEGRLARALSLSPIISPPSRPLVPHAGIFGRSKLKARARGAPRKDTGIAKERESTPNHAARCHGCEGKVTVADQPRRRSSRGGLCCPPRPLPDEHAPRVPDHCQLVDLSPPTLLENTRARFAGRRRSHLDDSCNQPVQVDHGHLDDQPVHNTACGPHVFSISERRFVS